MILDGGLIHEGLKHGSDASSVVLISNSSTIVAFSDEIVEGIKGNVIVHVVNVYLDLTATDSQVAFSEFIGYIPA